jgi:hypothetical protein
VGTARRLSGSVQFRIGLARVRHPNVVRLMHYGVHHETPFLVMEHVEGARTLAELAKTPPPAELLHHVIAQAARGLGAAHRRGIVHRDIKLANVMLQATDEDPYFVRIVDFGLAKFTEGGHHTQHVAGTVIYMAPEQFRREGIGPWTDVYALGQVALRVATGTAPYAALSHREIAAAKLEPDHDPAAGVVLGGYPEAVLAVLRRAFAPDPAARYEDGYAFAQAWDEAFGVQRSGRVPSTSTPIEAVTAVELDSVSTHLSVVRRRTPWPLLGLLGATIFGVVLGVALTAPSPEVKQTPERLQLQQPALPMVSAVSAAVPDAAPSRLLDASTPPPDASVYLPPPVAAFEARRGRTRRASLPVVVPPDAGVADAAPAPSSPYADALSEAQALIAEGAHASALERLRRALSIRPDAAPALALVCDLGVELGHHRRALEDCSRWLRHAHDPRTKARVNDQIRTLEAYLDAQPTP